MKEYITPSLRMTKNNIIFLISIAYLFMLPICFYGQESYYINNKGEISIGIELQNGGNIQNSKYCQVVRNDNIEKLTPYDIKEYKFKNGRTYFSKDIPLRDSTRKVFVERIYTGKANLYFYKGEKITFYFFEKDSNNFIPITKNNELNKSYKIQLQEITRDCPGFSRLIQQVIYRKNALVLLMNRYNTCDLRPFPHLRYGFSVGYNWINVAPYIKEVNEILDSLDYAKDNAFDFSVFFEYPLFVYNLSIKSGLSFMKQNYSYNKFNETKHFDLVTNINSLQVPLQLYYTFPFKRIRPFFSGGFLTSFNIKNENYLFETEVQENLYKIKLEKESQLIKKFYNAYCFGGGVEYDFNYKYSIFFEVKYFNQFNMMRKPKLFNSGINITTGLKL